MDSGVVEIGWIELVCATAFMVVAALISWKLKLGQQRRIAVSTLRCFLQLLACGFLLAYLFELQTWWLVAIVLICMVAAATQIALERVKSSVSGLAAPVFASIALSSLAAVALITQAVIHVDPWYNARELIPIAGMVIGNAMSSIAVAADRLFSGMDAREDEMFSLIALGATPFEAAFPSIKASIAAGMTPTLATMSAAGIVSIPGMMTGQILAGADPLGAAKYQIVILMAITAANTVAIMLACFLIYRKRFSDTGYYLDQGIRETEDGRR